MFCNQLWITGDIFRGFSVLVSTFGLHSSVKNKKGALTHKRGGVFRRKVNATLAVGMGGKRTAAKQTMDALQRKERVYQQRSDHFRFLELKVTFEVYTRWKHTFLHYDYKLWILTGTFSTVFYLCGWRTEG